MNALFKKLPNYFITQFLIFASIFIGTIAFISFRQNDNRITLAEGFYRKGEIATTIANRKENFNNALEIFLTLEKEYHPIQGTGKMYYNIGNTYFQLEEYPFSILYYKKAQALMPRSHLIKQNLSLSINKQGIQDDPTSFLDLLLLNPYLSIPERIQLFSAFTFICLALFSAWIWMEKKLLFKMAIVFLTFSGLLMLNLAMTHYLSPIKGVLIQTQDLRRDAGMEFAKVNDFPIIAGTTINIQALSSNRKWFKVTIPSGEFGYLPAETVKLIEQ